MNAKELIELSKQVIEGDHLDIDNYVAAERLVEHILATVKEDDDEPITEEQLSREPMFKYDYHADGYVLNNNNQSIFSKVKTRGQLRRLLEALGVEE